MTNFQFHYILFSIWVCVFLLFAKDKNNFPTFVAALCSICWLVLAILDKVKG